MTPQDGDELSRERERFFLNGSLSGARASETSLIHAYRTKSMASSEYTDADLDDEAHLASFVARTSASEVDVHGTSGTVLERTPDSWGRKRNTIFYSMTPSTGDQLRSVKRNLRRVSLRVINLASAGLGVPVRG